MTNELCISSVEYWDQRYQVNHEPYDWYNEWPALKPHLPPKLDETSRVLHIGCGTSTLGQTLFDEGVREVKNIDTSVNCINAMKERYPYLDYEVMDATNLATLLPEHSFDVVIDKGCLDTVLCSENFDVLIPKMLQGIHRVLRESGILMIISVGCPANRMMYLETSDMWSVTVVKIEKRHIELLEDAESLVNLSSSRFSNGLSEKYFDSSSETAHSTPIEDQEDYSACVDERRYHFIYICCNIKMCSSYVSAPMNGFHSYGDDDNEEVDFEGWLQVGPHNNNLVLESVTKCQGGVSGPKHCGNCGETPVCRKQFPDSGQTMGRNHRGPACGTRPCVNIVKRRGNGTCRCRGVDVTHVESDDVFYVNNKQHAPKILVQKPHTVIVRNHSRPPIVVQQPPPNVIVKNDPPQPVFVQNCPPNVVVKNERPSPVSKAPVLPMRYPQVVQTGYPPNYMKQCNCTRHNC